MGGGESAFRARETDNAVNHWIISKVSLELDAGSSSDADMKKKEAWKTFSPAENQQTDLRNN